MTARPNDGDSPSEESSVSRSNDDSSQPKAASSLFNRTRLMGARGLEASTIGWVLVGCIAFGFVVGNLADRHFGTSIWMPVGVMIGIAAGFREMFMTLKKLSKRDQAEREAKRLAAQNVPPPTQRDLKPRGADYEVPPSPTQTVQPERIFKVPPPPTASFEGGEVQSTLKPSEKLSEDELSEMDTEKLIEKLLGEAKDEDTDSHRKQA